MIRIPFTEPVTRIWKRWVKDCVKATQDLTKSYKPGTALEISDLYRRKSIKKDVYFAKGGPFKGRCAYCESYITDFQHGDVDHFRPKKGVTDENGNPVMINRAGDQKEAHPGYYWLAYNWRNLLPSCVACNQPREDGVGKHNRFPVKGGRYAINDQDIANESPLLLNPLNPDDEDPEEHLGVDLDSGFMTFKNGSARGEACIKIFGLNKRDQLVSDRRTAIDAVRAKYTEIIYARDDEERQILYQEIEAMEKGALNHTLARRVLSKKLRELFTNSGRV